MASKAKRSAAMMASGVSEHEDGKACIGVKRDPIKKNAPTMHLITIANCEAKDTKFGLAPLTVSNAMETPIEHAEFELTELPVFVSPVCQKEGMPWEKGHEEYKAFRSNLPSLTPESLFEYMAAPSGDCDAPQRSPAWHTARSFRVTGSQFASAAHENPNMSAAKLLEAKVYPSKDPFHGNAYTQWGSIHEIHAEDAFVQFLGTHLGPACRWDGEKNVPIQASDRLFSFTAKDFWFADGSTLEHPALLSTDATRWLGFSPDALLWNKDRTEVELIEYKCPAYQRSGPGHPYAAKNSICVPRQYMPQLQGSMHLLRERYPDVRCVRAWFVVWQPHQFFVAHVPYVSVYAKRTVDAGTTFFHDKFLPACVDAIKKREKESV